MINKLKPLINIYLTIFYAQKLRIMKGYYVCFVKVMLSYVKVSFSMANFAHLNLNSSS